MHVRLKTLALLAVMLASGLAVASPVRAGTRAEITDCSIENQTPSIPLGAQARYVVHLFGGSGSYSISFAYGDGSVDTVFVSATQATFAHWFQTTGSFTQTAFVRSASSSASCNPQTTVW